MELKVKNYNDFIMQACITIEDAHIVLAPLVNNFDYNHADRKQIDRNLVRMCVASQQLLDLVMPIKSTGEILGLPEEATKMDFQDKLLFVDKINPKWDFTNWFTEKVSSIKDSVNKLMEWLEINPSEYKLHLEATITAEKFISDMINMNFTGIREYTGKIPDMIDSGRLSVTNVRVEEED